MKKDHRGAPAESALLSIPQADGTFREDADLMAEMIAYCEQDVRAMRAVAQAHASAVRQKSCADYHVNERINDRGVLRGSAHCAQAAVRYAADRD